MSMGAGNRTTIDVDAGTIAYRDVGQGPPLVFVHGVGVNGDLWRKVVVRLADRYRCIVPDWPWGSHRIPLRRDADLSLPGMAGIVADFIGRLDLVDATVIGNDTGGAVAQELAAHHADRLTRLVLTSCDAFEKFPPTPQRYLLVAARSRLLMWFVAVAVQSRLVQRTPLAYGWVTTKPMPVRLMRSFTTPLFAIRGVRRDLRRLLLAVDTSHTFEAADGLRAFDKPALVAWAGNDRIFPREHGRRLADLLPQGRFVVIPNSRTFLQEDRPDDFADCLAAFLADGPPAAR
jgi:pimeloyl-ACP methyl ester carboxylesterase